MEKREFQHRLTKEEAIKVAHIAAERYAKKFKTFSPEVNWVHEDLATLQFSAGPISISAVIKVTDNTLVVAVKDIPLLFKGFLGQAMEIIEQEVQDVAEQYREGKYT